MFAGKSTELLRRVRRFQIAGKKCLTIKYNDDTRYSKTHISTHDHQMIEAKSCYRLEELDNQEGVSWTNFDVIGIDEGQFFEDVSTKIQKRVLRPTLIRFSITYFRLWNSQKMQLT